MRAIVCYSDSEDEPSEIIDDVEQIVLDMLLSMVESVVSLRPYPGAGIPYLFDTAAYRENLNVCSPATSENGFAFSFGADSDDSDTIFDNLDKCASAIQLPALSVPAVPGELSINDLPKIEKLSISVGEEIELLPAGVVDSIVGVLIVVKSAPNTPPLNEETFLFAHSRAAVGQIFETFGPVKAPYYCVRFNNAEEIADMNIQVGQTLFYANTNDFTCPVFVDALKKMKGTDASWKNDVEPPPEAIDFSDDEEERRHRRQLKAKRRRNSLHKNDAQGTNCYSGPSGLECHVRPAESAGRTHSPYCGPSHNSSHLSTFVPRLPSCFTPSLYFASTTSVPWYVPPAVPRPTNPLPPRMQQDRQPQ